MEKELSRLTIPVAFLRRRGSGELRLMSHQRAHGVIALLQPLDKPFPMIATGGRRPRSGGTILEDWEGCRVVELEVAHRPPMKSLPPLPESGAPVRAEAVPRETGTASLSRKA